METQKYCESESHWATTLYHIADGDRYQEPYLWAIVRFCLNIPRRHHQPSRNLCGAEKREHNLQRSEVEVEGTKERQSLSVENEYGSVALKVFRNQ